MQPRRKNTENFHTKRLRKSERALCQVAFFLKKRPNIKQLSWALTLRAVEGLCIFRGCDPVTGAGKRHALVGFYMLRWYKYAEFCILKGQNCVAWFGHGCG